MARPRDPRGALRWAVPWLGLVVTGVFVYLSVRGVHWGRARAALRSSEPWWLVPALAVLAAAVLLRAVRWRYLFAPETRPSLPATTRALIVGYFFNNVLPARAGEAARVVALHRSSGNSRAELAATVVVERVFDVVSLVVLLLVALPWFPHVSWATSAAILAGILCAGCVLVVVGVRIWGERPFRLLLRPLAFLPFLAEEQLGRAALNLTHGLAGVRRPRLAIAAFASTTLSWLGLALSTWFVLRAFQLGLSPLAGLLTVIAINLALILPSSPAAVGVFEAATLVALSAYGVSTSEALPVALVLHLVNLVPYLAAGAFVLRTAAREQGARAERPQPETRSSGSSVATTRRPPTS
jgi:glycosyltransferase 2 family protein